MFLLLLIALRTPFMALLLFLGYGNTTLALIKSGTYNEENI